ncbi:MAG: 3D domain-containing protein [Patescibacteria group bacterium]|nr:3D domain-containing protein [Patescibacteria group bacterium]
MKYKLLSILIGVGGLILISRYVYGSDKYLGIFKVTGYCNDKECTGKSPGDKGYGITKSGKVAKWGMVATDSKVIPLGTKLKIEGFDTIFVSEDIGGVIRKNKIDIWFSSHQDALDFGRQKRKVWTVKQN